MLKQSATPTDATSAFNCTVNCIAQAKPAKKTKKRYPDCKSPEYRAFCNMVSRTSNRNAPQFQRYGARGIHLCNSWNPKVVGWEKAWHNFYDAMGKRPKGKLASGMAKYSLHRINNEPLYHPWLCKWATLAEQNAVGQKRNRIIPAPIGFKRCCRCKDIKTTGEFYKCRTKKDGLDVRCKACTKIVHDASKARKAAH